MRNALHPLLFFFVLLFAAVLPLGAQEVSLPTLLDQLDNAIEMRHDVAERKEQKINELRTLLRRSQPSAQLELAETLFNEYRGYRTDSALTYAKMVYHLASLPAVASPSRQQRALIELASCYSIYGNYAKAEETLQSIGPELLPENASLYYNALVLLYVWRADYARMQEERDTYYRQVIAYRDSVYKYEIDPIMRIQQRSLSRLDSDLDGAKNELRAVMPRIAGNDDYLRYISNSLASCYKRLGVRDSACYYYALSALADMHCGVQEHSSLRELALLLFDTGDITRAYRYTNCCLEDAQECGAQLRMTQMAGDMPGIMTTYQTLVGKQKNLLSVAIGILVVLLIIVGGFTIYMLRITKRLHSARRELQGANDTLHHQHTQLEASLAETRVANDHLQEANQVKESFVAQYMAQCMQSLEQLEKYRHQLLHLATSGVTLNRIVAELRDSSIADAERKAFIDRFDRSFLSLFPTFIDEFNALLTPEARIVLSEGRLMTTELRIYALIRLGITESEDIAGFIGKSVKTIYNYRAQMRNKALGDRDAFDTQVARLCSNR